MERDCEILPRLRYETVNILCRIRYMYETETNGISVLDCRKRCFEKVKKMMILIKCYAIVIAFDWLKKKQEEEVRKCSSMCSIQNYFIKNFEGKVSLYLSHMGLILPFQMRIDTLKFLCEMAYIIDNNYPCTCLCHHYIVWCYVYFTT